MIILVGESSSGKSSIERSLKENYGYRSIISYTTRPPRNYEENGVDYHFIDKSEFEKLKSQGFFAETAVYNGWCYGTAKKDYIKDSLNAVVVLTPHGLRQVKKNVECLSTIVSCYICVPRRDRLIKALQRGDSIEEAYRRNLSDVGQFDGVEDEVDYTVYNNGYEYTVDTMADFINMYYKAKIEYGG